jgi:hypothetical protein
MIHKQQTKYDLSELLIKININIISFIQLELQTSRDQNFGSLVKEFLLFGVNDFRIIISGHFKLIKFKFFSEIIVKLKKLRKIKIS